MIQFNQQYIRDYFKPFLQEVLTDMSTTMDKGDPLYKIKNQIQISAVDQEVFEKKYFLGKQPAKRPFTGQDEGEYRKYFLEELTSHVNTMIRLSNVKGMRQALLPDAEVGRTFGSHQKLTENLNRLSIKLARKFEKRKIRAKLTEEGELTEEKQRRLENGEMKLVEIDGKEEVKTEEEMVEMARKEPQKTVVPSIEPGIEKMFARMEGGAPANEKPTENPAPPEKKPIAITAVGNDFDTAKIASVREILMESGLEITEEMKIENGVVSGIVRDVEGQELKVSVNTRKPNYDASKFVFTFTANGPHPELEGYRIPVSQNDLHSAFFGAEGKRKPAEKVFKEQDARGTMAKGKFQPQPKPDIIRKEPLFKGPELPPKDIDISLQAQPKPIVGPPTLTGGQLIRKGQIAGGAHIVRTFAAPQKIVRPKASQIRKDIAGARIQGPQPISHKVTIAEKKKKMAEQKKAAEEAQQQRNPEKPRQRPELAIAAPPQQQKKKGIPGLGKLGLGTGGGGIALIIAGAYQAATADAKTVELTLKTVKVVLSCLGIDCLV